MRRMTVILALVVGVFGIAMPPAGAHSCARPTRYEVGVAGQVTIGVPAEDVVVTAVDVVVPPGFRLDEVRPVAGWTVKRDGARIVYSGGTVTEFACGYFTIVGAPTKKGVLRFELVAYHPDGEITEYRDPDPASLYSPQLVLAGVDEDVLFPKEKNDKAWMGKVGSLLIGAGVAGLVILFVRRRRSEPA